MAKKNTPKEKNVNAGEEVTDKTQMQENVQEVKEKKTRKPKQPKEVTAEETQPKEENIKKDNETHKADVTDPAELKEKNLSYLKNQLLYLGFGDKLNVALTEAINTGANRFSIELKSEIGTFKNKASFEVQFNKLEDKDLFYIDRYKASLEGKNGEIKEQTFKIYKENNITAKEAVNLLEGRTVYKNMYNHTAPGEENLVWMKLDFDNKNQNGNYKYKTFSKGYGIDVEKILSDKKIIFDNQNHKDITIKSLQKGNIAQLKFDNNGTVVEAQGFINAQYKTLNLYDKQMKPINLEAPDITASLGQNKR